MSAIIVITNVPDREVAQKIAHTLVERRLAACVAGASSTARLQHAALHMLHEDFEMEMTRHELRPRI